MKQIVFFLLVVFIFSCNNHEINKPENLLDESTMLDLMYDMAIIQAIKSTGEYTLIDNKIEVTKLLNEKYKIDEKTWLENNEYYASDIKKYKLMIEEVLARLEKKKAGFEVVNKPKKQKT